ncbi:glycerophosphoryl diester phosphodiesterase [Spirosoma montaniterrae]|uniref:Glycerophosphoryl diester phosphodiesterase n=1 Tax=Spirosoma montaniterrae TaxID=1178516 RepID=A0A1P9X2W0_9BACT|nr:glycerophosphoryl diester phosphodiesterase [Spirosoma montaniterrae]AQG81970.1 glycerophosphoryl diester phosphodiesterase [Spirosoma montaniterrae]
MNIGWKSGFWLGVAVLATSALNLCLAQTAKRMSLNNERLSLTWQQSPVGWRLQSVRVQGKALPDPSGQYTLLYAAQKPDVTPDTTFKTITGVAFPEPNYVYQKEKWKEVISPVALNRRSGDPVGTALPFYPKKAVSLSVNRLRFEGETDVATLQTDWQLDPQFSSDVLVTQTLVAKRAGYFSLPTPTLATTPDADMTWATVPGYFQGNRPQPNFALAYTYGHGVPTLPVVYRERAASTLAPIVTNKSGVTLAVIPDPMLARDPWPADKNRNAGPRHNDWNLGLSHRNRQGQLSPTLYYPVLGEPKSALRAGDTLRYTFRYHLTTGDWFSALKHAANDIFRFGETLNLRQNRQSLTDRVRRMHHYLTDPKTSLWNVEEFEGLSIGAQSYLGGVVGSQKDAMKNSDYGAMWMLATATQDTLLTRNVLPYALNFKKVQQITADGFFRGALAGQYYLAKRKRFTEEWGEVVEPIAVTYYTMLDVGNMLLFDPNNTDLRERLRLGAEWLLNNQKPDGSWAVAYDRQTADEQFKDIADLRPTFYGLLVAHRILGDSRYLAAARRGADWQIRNGVQNGSFLGVCGDARYVPDFATAQTAQALLDLYDLTNEPRYREAAIAAAKIYTASVYTHPIADRSPRTVNGRTREAWEIAQSGLSFEHGGVFGSANMHGPIQLASHAGLFIRMHKLTGEALFADMARAAAWGRHAFVDSTTSVASYYWNAMNRGAGPYPHHAWWQIGWITDYLMAEAELRSNGQIRFPRGFVTPKVGPHQTYGFAPGAIYGQAATLTIGDNEPTPDNPNVEVISARAVTGKRRFAILMNNSLQPAATTVRMPTNGPVRTVPEGQAITNQTITLPPLGLAVWEF